MTMKFGSMASGWMGLVITVALAFSAPVFARAHEGGGDGMWHAKRLTRMLDGVNATPDQRQQIQQIARILTPDMKALHQAHRDLMAKNLQLLSAPVIDENAIEQNRLQMVAQHDQVSKRMSAAFIEMAKVLTPEQRTQVAARMQERLARRGAHRHHGGDHPSGSSAPAPMAPEPSR